MYEIKSFGGGISDYEDRGIMGSFKFGYGLDIRRPVDSLTANQALVDEGVILQSISASQSPSASYSPSPSNSPSISASISPSSSFSPSMGSHSASISPSASRSPSASASPSSSRSPSSSVSPSPSPAIGSKTVFHDLIRFFVKCSDGNTYGFGNTGKVYKRTPDPVWLQVYDAGQQIKGAEEKPSSGGKTYLIFATNTNLLRKEIPGLSNWDDVNKPGTVQGDEWPKTNLTSADWHTMKQVDGDVLIANGSTLAMSAYDDSYTNEALDLVPGNIAKTLIERSGRVVIGTYRASDPTKGINAAIDSEVPLAQVGDDGQIIYSNFVDSIPAKRFPGGGKVNPGGVTNLIEQANFFDWASTALSWIDKKTVGNLALFGVFGATTGYNGIYSYGRKNKNKPFVMNLEYKLEVDEIGAIIVVNGTVLASYRSGSNFGVMAVDLTRKATAVYEGLDFKSPAKDATSISHYKYAELFMAPLPSGTSVEFWYKMNKTGNFIQGKCADGSTSFSTANGEKAVFSIGTEGQVYEPRVVLNPLLNLSPEVYRIRTYFA